MSSLLQLYIHLNTAHWKLQEILCNSPLWYAPVVYSWRNKQLAVKRQLQYFFSKLLRSLSKKRQQSSIFSAFLRQITVQNIFRSQNCMISRRILKKVNPCWHFPPLSLKNQSMLAFSMVPTQKFQKNPSMLANVYLLKWKFSSKSVNTWLQNAARCGSKLDLLTTGAHHSSSSR